MSPPLRHLPLPPLTPYLPTARLTHHLLTQHTHARTHLTPPPPPTVITTTFPPTYTLGRRTRLPPPALAALRTSLAPATVLPTARGGQTTFHGPGQLVAYPIIALRAHSLSPRAYVALLESTTVRVLHSLGVRGARACMDGNPGVYTAAGEKIASVGVRVRGGVTAHGVALNVDMDLRWWERIEVCGIPGMRATDVRAQGVRVGVPEVAEMWVAEFARGVGAGGVVVEGAGEGEVAAMARAVAGEEEGEL